MSVHVSVCRSKDALHYLIGALLLGMITIGGALPQAAYAQIEDPYEARGERVERGVDAGNLPSWADPQSGIGDRSTGDARLQHSVTTNDDPAPPPGDVESIPVDGGVTWLFGAGMLYGFYRLRQRKAMALR